ncbi:MAG: 2-octaprenyl-3-methyl-6-methoxy-1,4-benzoquinol hydroxylase [Gammaproteobacteria bacterium]|nr:MAG: 2-octaprenyl-3-methyl-6-methoxy-1,4-benzoquinol hydroxylase [Gammaproteobacteria bacterium]
MDDSLDYDIVIVGAGMVGSALACALGSQMESSQMPGNPSPRIALIEANSPADWQGEYDIRVSAITPASVNIFHNIGAWSSMESGETGRVSPFRQMHVWDAAGSGKIHFDSADIGEPLLGYIIENRVILKALETRLNELGCVNRLCPVRLEGIEMSTDSARVILDDGQQIRCQLLVGADGASSPVRQMSGINTSGWLYQQHGVVAVIETSASHQETAWQRFLPTGPLAFLPLPDPNLCSIVWSTTPQQAEALVTMPEAEFLQQLQQAIGDHLGEMIATGPRAHFPLRLQHAHEYVKPRMCLVGDAAHNVHPLAGQGVNLGLADVAALTEVLADAWPASDLGAMQRLRRYERWRKGENVSMMLTFDGFKRLFGSQFGPLKLLRNVGLNLTEALPPLKDLIMRHSLGVYSDSARLSRRKTP